MRPTLLPNLRRLWRDTHTVQLGTDPATAVVLEFDDPAAVRLLDLLDGSRTEHAVHVEAAALGVDPETTDCLLEALTSAGVLVPANTLLPVGLPDPVRRRLIGEATALALRRTAALAPGRTGRSVPDAVPATAATSPSATAAGSTATTATPTAPAAAPTATAAPTASATPTASASADSPGRTGPSAPSGGRSPADMLRRRSAARVLVAGEGVLVALISAALAQAGVGHVDPAVDGTVDARDAVVGGLLHADAKRARSIATVEAVTRAAPGVDVSRIRSDAATFLVRVGARIPTALAARGYRTRRIPRLTVVVRDGVVVVGPLVRPTGSPCGTCLDLHRSDRDPAWPALAAQLETAPEEAQTCAVTTALAAAAYAAEEVLSYIDGRAGRTTGATVEVARAGDVRRRTWPAHPRCDCGRRHRTLEAGRKDG